jgi:hypothetical protein
MPQRVINVDYRAFLGVARSGRAKTVGIRGSSPTVKEGFDLRLGALLNSRATAPSGIPKSEFKYEFKLGPLPHFDKS